MILEPSFLIQFEVIANICRKTKLRWNIFLIGEEKQDLQILQNSIYDIIWLWVANNILI